MKLLVTGFEPFGEHSANPTQRLVESLKLRAFRHVEVETAILPVVFDVCVERLLKLIETVRPDVVICCGLAAGRASVSVERIGINVKDVGDATASADNRGAQPRGERIVPGGPDGLFATIPVADIVRKMKEAGIPAAISNSAGTYICNNVLYGALQAIQERRLPIRAGFIHFPATPEMAASRAAMPSMTLDMMKMALAVAIDTVAAD